MFRTVGCVALLSAGMTLTARAANERGLWDIWTMHRDRPDDHVEVIAACAEFVKATPNDPLVVVVRSIGAWHMLAAGKPTLAVQQLTPLLQKSADPLRTASAEMARAWLTRLDAIQLRTGLRAYYRKHVAFPEQLQALESLPNSETFRLTDRWDRPWEYKLVGFKMLPDMRDQRYELHCAYLGETLDIKDALALPYGERIQLEGAGLDRRSNPPVVIFRRTDDKEGKQSPPVYLLPGRRDRGVTLAFVGDRIMILANLNHWKVLPKPQ